MRRWAFGAGLAVLINVSSCSAGDKPRQFEQGMTALMEGNYAEAYCLWKPLAERGYAEAQYHIGWLYANGNGLAVDIERALAWWMRAAAGGHADAEFAVGLAYTTGEGIKKDLDEAVKWYLAAARQGHGDARDILVRLNGDPALDLLQAHPELAREAWFGWAATIDSDRINVRAGPGTGHKIVASLEKNAQVRIVGTRGEWLMVALPPAKGGTVAWIHKSLVSSVGR